MTRQPATDAPPQRDTVGTRSLSDIAEAQSRIYKLAALRLFLENNPNDVSVSRNAMRNTLGGRRIKPLVTSTGDATDYDLNKERHRRYVDDVFDRIGALADGSRDQNAMAPIRSIMDARLPRSWYKDESRFRLSFSDNLPVRSNGQALHGFVQSAWEADRLNGLLNRVSEYNRTGDHYTNVIRQLLSQEHIRPIIEQPDHIDFAHPNTAHLITQTREEAARILSGSRSQIARQLLGTLGAAPNPIWMDEARFLLPLNGVRGHHPEFRHQSAWYPANSDWRRHDGTLRSANGLTAHPEGPRPRQRRSQLDQDRASWDRVRRNASTQTSGTTKKVSSNITLSRR